MRQRCLFILLWIAVSTIAGCDKDNNAPRLIVQTPAESSINAARVGSIAGGPLVKAQFNEALRESSVPSSSIVLEYDGEALPGVFAFSAAVNTVAFEPIEPLFFLREYTARVRSGISDLEGNRIKADITWSFRVTDGVFSSSNLVEVNTEKATQPQIAFGSNQLGQMIWTQSDGTRTSIWARAIAGRNFSADNLPNTLKLPTAIEDKDNASDAGDANSPQVAVDSTGNAIAVWSQSDGTRFNIWANHYTPPADATTDGWSVNPVLLDTDDSGHATAPQIAYTADGSSAIAVWVQSDGFTTDIWARRFSAGTWSAPAIIDNNAAAAAAPQIVIDSNNNAIAIWVQNNRIYENRQIAGAWGTAVPIDDGAGTAAEPQIAADSQGNAIAVWSQHDGTRTNIWANRFSGGVWGAAALIESNDTGNANAPQVAMNSAGSAMATWSQFAAADGDPRFRIYVGHFTPSGGWEQPVLIDNFSPAVYIPEVVAKGVSTQPQVVIDGDGNAVVLWVVQSTSTDPAFVPVKFIAANRYRGPSAREDLRGWPNAAIIDITTAPFTGDANAPQIAITPDFTAMSVWEKDEVTAGTVTITIASPGVVSWTAHGLKNDREVVLRTTGSLPTGLTAGTIYYVRNATADSFELSATPGGTSINTSGTQSGAHTANALLTSIRMNTFYN